MLYRKMILSGSNKANSINPGVASFETDYISNVRNPLSLCPSRPSHPRPSKHTSPTRSSHGDHEDTRARAHTQ